MTAGTTGSAISVAINVSCWNKLLAIEIQRSCAIPKDTQHDKTKYDFSRCCILSQYAWGLQPCAKSLRQVDFKWPALHSAALQGWQHL
eukprot:5755664-Amphidinium_carterae.1